MKKLALILFFISCYSSSYAQITTLAAQYNAEFFLQHVDRIGSNNLDYLDDGYTGTPYGNPIFLLGSIYEKNQVIASNYALRYVAITDEIEVKETLYVEDKDIQALAKSPDLYVKIMNDMYVYVLENEVIASPGYFNVLFVGDNYNLYKKVLKKYYPAKKAQTSFEQDVLASFVDKPIYYLVTQNGKFIEFGSSKNKKFQAFEGKESEMKKYVNKAKLDINNEDDLIKIVQYYDTIVVSNQ